MIYRFSSDISSLILPDIFPSPFTSTPAQIVRVASEQLKEQICMLHDDARELSQGKMFGVMVVEKDGELGFLAAFSGTLGGELVREGFVPPIFDYSHPNGYYMGQEDKISAINSQIILLESQPNYVGLKNDLDTIKRNAECEIAAMRTAYQSAKELRAIERDSPTASPQRLGELSAESQRQKGDLKRLHRFWQAQIEQAQAKLSSLDANINALKKERKERSATLHKWLFDNFMVLNGKGESCSLSDIFATTSLKVPPSGAGECAAPKLLHYAYANNLRPVAMGEFWWGASPKGVVRHDGNFYEACRGKCVPILGYMLDGISVEGAATIALEQEVHIDVLYEDANILVVDKPSGLLTVPGRGSSPSLYSILSKDRPSVMVVHRLDMDTSGLVVLAKDMDSYRHLQRQFAQREVSKLYTALLSGVVSPSQGVVSLPLIPDILDRPRQKVDYQKGKPATTHYKVVGESVVGSVPTTRILFTPITGRTHQLRLHSAHADGLGAPIVGDRLYGSLSDRLCLHATQLSFVHPATGEELSFCSPVPF